MKWIKAFVIGLAILLLATAEVVAYPGPYDYYGNTTTLTVEGEGRISVPPDMITIAVGIYSSNANATAAAAQTHAKMDNVISALQADGISKADFLGRSSGVSASGGGFIQLCNNTTCISKNFTNTNVIQDQILIKLNTTDVSAVRKIHDIAIAAGANETTVIGYGLRDPKTAIDMARQRAVDNARSNAEMLASAAGVKVGKVLNVYEYPGGYMDQGWMSPAIGPSMPGLIDVTSDVVVTYEIIQ